MVRRMVVARPREEIRIGPYTGSESREVGLVLTDILISGNPEVSPVVAMPHRRRRALLIRASIGYTEVSV